MVFLDFYNCIKAAAQLSATHEIALISQVTNGGGDHIFSLVLVTAVPQKPHCQDNRQKQEIQECGALWCNWGAPNSEELPAIAANLKPPPKAV